MIVFNLKKEWFEKIKAGKKTHEYRVFNEYWSKRLLGDYSMNIKHQRCVFCMGYPRKDDKHKRLNAIITKFSIVDGRNTDLQYNGKVFDIEFKLL